MSTNGRLGFGDIVPRSALVSEWDTRTDQYLDEGLFFEIQHTWDGKQFGKDVEAEEQHEPIKIQMKWHFERMQGRPHKRVIRVRIQAPLFDDPEQPECMAGICPGLWNFECVELFFANHLGHYTEVEVGPHGHWLVLLHKGYRECFNTGEELQLNVSNEWKGAGWNCTVEIPLAYLPGNVSKFNAYALHGSGSRRHYESLFAVTDGSVKEPDFHRLEYFGRIDTKRIIPADYNRKPFDDLKYGNLWKDALSKADGGGGE